jgi:hypothetical protein
MTNILEAIFNIVNYQNFNIKTIHSGRNRMNSMGTALESYVIDAFANTFTVNDELKRQQIHNQKFSWLGNQNNPPDAMIRNGDAIEVKKTQSPNAGLALNSSYPKSTIRSKSTLIAKGCRECETWEERDIIYAVGHTTDDTLKSLWFVYGNIYAADHETYELIKNTIKTGVNEIPNVEFADTKELGGVKRVDPLGITNLRIRGMWHIHNPRTVFNYLHTKTDKDFELVCIIPTEKYNSFPKESRAKLEGINENDFSIEDKQIKDPNNPAKLMDCKLIKLLV